MSKREPKIGDIWACRDRSRIVLVVEHGNVLCLYSTSDNGGEIRDNTYQGICIDYIGSIKDLEWDDWKRIMPK